MLQRVQLLIDSKTKRDLETLALLSERSMSDVAREVLKEGITKANKKKSKDGGTSALLEWAKNAVKGPGDSEYDKYAYDL